MVTDLLFFFLFFLKKMPSSDFQNFSQPLRQTGAHRLKVKNLLLLPLALPAQVESDFRSLPFKNKQDAAAAPLFYQGCLTFPHLHFHVV